MNPFLTNLQQKINGVWALACRGQRQRVDNQVLQEIHNLFLGWMVGKTPI